VEGGVGGRLIVCSELEAVWSESVMVQCTSICTGRNEVNNKAIQLTIAGLWAEILNVKQECRLLRLFLEIVHVFRLIKRFLMCSRVMYLTYSSSSEHATVVNT
jgi:hypothetical protein